jgi:cysteine desulfurase / selenocysteine lyase
VFDANTIRTQFPILSRKVNGQPLVYFDNGATTQKPKRVIDSIVNYYSLHNANIHRGVHTLSREATDLFEQARRTLATFLGAEEQEIIFTAGTTDAINMVASGLNMAKGSEIVITHMEHHSNILPWQLWCEKNNGKLKVIPINHHGELQWENLEAYVTKHTSVLSITQVSNTLGVINPVKDIIKAAKKINPDIQVLVDGAQAVPHLKVDVKDLDCDYYVFSGHKIYGPTGTGVLYAKSQRMNELRLSRTGGGTIKTVSFEKTEYIDGPLRFEPGTPNIEGVVALAEAIAFVTEIGMNALSEYEHSLLTYAQQKLSEFPEVEIYANHLNKAAVISFNVKGQHPFDVGTLLDKYGIAVRTGHHCTQPLMAFYNIPGTIRASFAVYNTKEEIDVFINALIKVIKMLS